jgi:hypothetical protein
MGGYFWQEAVSSLNSLVGLEAHDFAVVTALLPGLDARDGSQRPGSRARDRGQIRKFQNGDPVRPHDWGGRRAAACCQGWVGGAIAAALNDYLLNKIKKVLSGGYETSFFFFFLFCVDEG